MRPEDITTLALTFEERLAADGSLKLGEKESALVITALREYAALRKRREIARAERGAPPIASSGAK